MIKKLPIILIITVIASIILNPIIPPIVKEVIFAVSLTVKSIVIFFLPFIIFGLLFKTFVKLSENAFGVIILIFGTLVCSNFFNTFVTHYLGSVIYNSDLSFSSEAIQSVKLKPYFEFEVPSIIKNDYALFSGIFLGWATAMYNRKFAIKVANFMIIIVQKIFSIISVLIPMFIIGFVIKCSSEGTLIGILKSYSQILAIFLVYAIFYTFLFFLISCRFHLREAFHDLKNMIPAWLTAVSTISSAATMPVTIVCVEKNVKNKELADSVVSSSVNIHLLGDCLSIPLLAYALAKHYGLDEPTLFEYLKFTCCFVIAKFSVAAVPAGGVIIMAPIVEKYFGFNSEISTLLIATYVVFDPFVTGFNVLGNGAFAKIIDNLHSSKYLNFLLERKRTNSNNSE